MSTSVQPASFPATQARTWALVAVPRSGNRGANSALYRIALVRMSTDARANEFAAAADRSDFLPVDVGR
ncbi:hypothetical protein ACFYQ5_02995 [Streptomyces sp. NPDC005794]|uniref:hypothetical protein n=1 Tax=Streptomyces sp. NPDC005794 TaxID=3364733 RepID=UPI0036B1620D